MKKKEAITVKKKEAITVKKTMCGLVKETAGPSSLVYHTDLPVPEIAEDEVLIQVKCAAVCGTDLHIMEWDEWSRNAHYPAHHPRP